MGLQTDWRPWNAASCSSRPSANAELGALGVPAEAAGGLDEEPAALPVHVVQAQLRVVDRLVWSVVEEEHRRRPRAVARDPLDAVRRRAAVLDDEARQLFIGDRGVEV